MNQQERYEERQTAIALLKAGRSATEVGRQLGRSPQWVNKWRRRYELKGTSGLHDQSRAPHLPGQRLPEETRQAILAARLSLEKQRQSGVGLKYIGGRAIRTRLRERGVTPLPSVATIERVIRRAGMTHPRRAAAAVTYPRLNPTAEHQLAQIDIVPHYLRGGERVACFNGLDVFSRYPTGLPFAQRRAEEAARFLLHYWQTVGVPTYTQVDNEGCFSGGTTHPYVLGRVVRLALTVGTELVFSPVAHPESNGYVERFHQDYNAHVWQDTYLADIEQVAQQSTHFFTHYRHSSHHRALAGQSPEERHTQTPPKCLPAEVQLAATKRPLYAGRVHFIRRVTPQQTIRILNVNWSIPAQPDTGVWATLELLPTGGKLYIFDEAPDKESRRCLAIHPFPLKEAVHPRPEFEPLAWHSQGETILSDEESPLQILAEGFFARIQASVRTGLEQLFARHLHR